MYIGEILRAFVKQCYKCSKRTETISKDCQDSLTVMLNIQQGVLPVDPLCEWGDCKEFEEGGEPVLPQFDIGLVWYPGDGWVSRLSPYIGGAIP